MIDKTRTGDVAMMISDAARKSREGLNSNNRTISVNSGSGSVMISNAATMIAIAGAETTVTTIIAGQISNALNGAGVKNNPGDNVRMIFVAVMKIGSGNRSSANNIFDNSAA